MVDAPPDPALVVPLKEIPGHALASHDGVSRVATQARRRFLQLMKSSALSVRMVSERSCAVNTKTLMRAKRNHLLRWRAQETARERHARCACVCATWEDARRSESRAVSRFRLQRAGTESIPSTRRVPIHPARGSARSTFRGCLPRRCMRIPRLAHVLASPCPRNTQKTCQSLIVLSRVNDISTGARATVLRNVRAIDYDNVTRSERPRVRSTNRRA